MTTQGIGTISPQPYASQSSSPASSLRQNFRSLDSALLNGDLTGAQSALASLQQAVSGASGSANANSISSQLGQSSSPLGQDLQAVASALSASDLGGAQKAYAKLQQDMQGALQANGAAHAHHGHHAHHAKANDGDADDNSTSSASSAAAINSLLQSMSNAQSTGSSASDLFNALQSLAASNPKVAGDLVSLVNDLNSTGKVVNTTA